MSKLSRDKKKKDYIQVVINNGFGGFSLSDAAVEQCVEHGMKCTVYGPDGAYLDRDADFVKSVRVLSGMSYYTIEGDRKEFRTNPIVLRVVRKLRDRANGSYATLKIIRIPFVDLEGWEIEEYDGAESVVETHRRWS